MRPPEQQAHDTAPSKRSEALYSRDAEQALLGCALIAGWDVIDGTRVSPADFYLHTHGWVWDAMTTLRTQRMRVDTLTVAHVLESRNRLDEIGGQAYLTELVTSVPTSVHADEYARIVVSFAKRRELLALAQSAASDAYNLSIDPDETRSRIMSDAAKGARVDGGARHVSEIAEDLREEIEERIENPRDIFGIATGFTDYDEITGGIELGTYTILTGKPATGKSLLLAQAAFQMSGLDFDTMTVRADAPAGALYGLEMKDKAYLRRSVSAMTQINSRALKSGRVKEHEMQFLSHGLDVIGTPRLYISDDAKLTTTALRADLHRLKSLYDIKFCVLDYFQLLADRFSASTSPTEREVQISLALRNMAKDLNIAMVAISRLNKSGLSKRVPDLEDFAGSVQIPYDADVAVVLTEHIPDGEDETPDKRLRTVTFRKMREAENKTSFDLVIGAGGLPVFKNAATVSVGDAQRNASARKPPAPARRPEPQAKTRRDPAASWTDDI